MAPLLGYWDLRGLASTIRNLLYFKGVEFVDKLYQIGPAPEYDLSEWISDRLALGLDFPNLPYYIDGDVKLSQVQHKQLQRIWHHFRSIPTYLFLPSPMKSTTILRYLARKYDLVGDNETQTQRIELMEQQAIDLRYKLIHMAYDNPNFEKDRQDHLAQLPEFIRQVENFLGTNKWVAGEKFTYVDFLLYDALDFNRMFDPKSFESTTVANAFLDRFESIPEIKAYMNSGKYHKLPVFGPMAAWGGQRE